MDGCGNIGLIDGIYGRSIAHEYLLQEPEFCKGERHNSAEDR